MRLAIFGATGGIGGHLLNWAVDAGHDVQVLARNAAALPSRTGLTVTQGDVLDPAGVAQVIAGTDAVLSALGPRGLDGFRKTELLAPAAQNIVAGMNKNGVHRLIMVSAAGAFIQGDPDVPWLAKQALSLVFARTFADVRHMEQIVRSSDLDWTLVRPARLLNEPGRGEYRVRPDYPPKGGAKIARADVARFIHTTLTENTHLHESPAITY
jgi:putative NADH-flavin reductase